MFEIKRLFREKISSHLLSAISTMQTTSVHTLIILQYKLINCKTEITFIQTTYNPVILPCTFVVCAIQRWSFWHETCCKHISHIHSKQTLVVMSIIILSLCYIDSSYVCRCLKGAIAVYVERKLCLLFANGEGYSHCNCHMVCIWFPFWWLVNVTPERNFLWVLCSWPSLTVTGKCYRAALQNSATTLERQKGKACRSLHIQVMLTDHSVFLLCRFIWCSK
jgi:hypothetical protein